MYLLNFFGWLIPIELNDIVPSLSLFHAVVLDHWLYSRSFINRITSSLYTLNQYWNIY
jgi:hypothetical protein